MKPRTVFFWLHFAAGTMAGGIILVMSVTGVLLAFERQLLTLAERQDRLAPPPIPGMPRLSLEAIVASARAAVPDSEPSALTLYADSAASTLVNFGREQVVFVDTYTGAVRGGGATYARAFFRSVTDWHRWLGMPLEHRAFGRAITGACNAAFMVLVLSGLYLWWPRRWTWGALKAVTIPTLTMRGKPRDWNWHNAIGCWSAAVLLCITLSGLVISYQWAGKLIYILTGSEPPQSLPPTRPDQPARGSKQTGSLQPQANLDAVFAAIVQQAPHWRLIHLRLPQAGATQVSVLVEEAESWHPHPRSTLILDATDAAVVRWEPFASYNLGRTLRSWVRPVHTGEAGGLIGQGLAAAASAGGAMLVYTGLALAWRRGWQFVGRQRRARRIRSDDNQKTIQSQGS